MSYISYKLMFTINSKNVSYTCHLIGIKATSENFSHVLKIALLSKVIIRFLSIHNMCVLQC